MLVSSFVRAFFVSQIKCFWKPFPLIILHDKSIFTRATVVAEYRFRWLSCIFIPVGKLQLLHHPDVLQSSAIANSLIQRLFKWIWSSLFELFKVFFTWIYLIVEQQCGWKILYLGHKYAHNALHKKGQCHSVNNRTFAIARHKFTLTICPVYSKQPELTPSGRLVYD